MSDAMANKTAAPRSARAAALERRSALSQNGRAALGTKPSAPARPAAGSVTTATTAPAPKAATETARPSAPATVASPVASASGKSLSRARREALSHAGKAALGRPGTISNVSHSAPAAVAPVAADKPASDCGCAVASAAAPVSDCGCKSRDGAEEAERDQAIEEVCAIVENEPASVTGSAASAVRKLCQERRRALSSQGKMAAKFSKIRLPASSGLSGRAAAQARRAELCEKGRNDDQACRPTGRMRPRTPSKVETGTTLSGNTVSGTQVERTSKVTGGETGSCRAITGTEYIGAEQYGSLCATVPPAAAAKVSVSSTGRGQRVSGVEVDRSVKMTGGESGACKNVTGTEYLSADKFESFCAAKPPLSPVKVGMGVTRGGLNVSGTEEGRSVKVTGDESGACNSKLTGSQYSMEPTSSACRNGSGAPHKVTQMSTLKNRVVTGTDVIPGGAVTGSDRGACADVTGTESNGLAQYQACNRVPAAGPEKIGVMRTWRDQQVSGTSVEHSDKVTGDDYGACQVISGTEYIGPDQYSTFCDEERQTASRALMSSRTAMGSLPLSGTRVESGGKVTGAERGENLVLSGSPYAGPHQRVSQRGANSNQHPLTRRPGNGLRESAPEPEPAARAQGDFSIVPPSRSGRESAVNRITGTAYGAVGRITGPVNLAAGLVSGTPEFRYQDGAAPVAPVQPVDEARNRLTGDGREGGFAITGAAWRRNESVTGTDGTSTRRNPTMRGEQRGAMMGASQLKDRERPELPVSRITGSSGNDTKGSAITYSGGARG
ncbi:MAG TPA: CsoS2 family carboxysome shell protein [Burkholderiales bacterium]|nr:CsoS2 family carboxysome shell protein [Burkholderiales bacterium]